MSIQESWAKIKPKTNLPTVETVSYNDEGIIETPSIFKKIFIPLVIILVTSLAFGLGRLSKETKPNTIKLEYDPKLAGETASVNSSVNPTPVNTPPATNSNSSQSSLEVVGSIKGTKYHYLYCPGAKQISAANKITFKDAHAAEAAGYTLALNCKPK